jgi:alkylhydroperoxidase family enzyme
VTIDPYLAERRALVEAVTDSQGSLSAEVRRALLDRAAGRPAAGPIAEKLGGFVDQVARNATNVRDEDIAALTADGLDEEAVFEAIVAAALGASLARLERVDQLLTEGTDHAPSNR